MTWNWLETADWMADAACSGQKTDIFFDEDRIEEAREICAACPAGSATGDSQCRLWAFEQRLYGDETGVYDGLLPRQRRSIARQIRKKKQLRREAGVI